MEQPIAVFEPMRSGNYNIVIIGLLIAAIALVFLIYNLKKDVSYKFKNYKQLFSLLAFFVIIISGTTSFFSFWAVQKFTPVKVFQDSIETSFGIAKFDEINKVYIHNDQQKSLLTNAFEGDITRILIIEEIDRKTHALSEENYDIDSLLKILNTIEKENINLNK